MGRRPDTIRELFKTIDLIVLKLLSGSSLFLKYRLQSWCGLKDRPAFYQLPLGSCPCLIVDSPHNGLSTFTWLTPSFSSLAICSNITSSKQSFPVSYTTSPITGNPSTLLFTGRAISNPVLSPCTHLSNAWSRKRATDLHAEWKGELSTLAFSSSRPILFPVADVIFKTCSVAVHSVSSVCCGGDNDLPLLSVS